MNGTHKKIGNYEIIREIGRGGMGVVYLVKHPTLGIEVALKALYPDPSRQGDDPELIAAQERFKNEAELTARLKDVHIIKVYDYGIDEPTGVLYIVMDYLDGGTLKDSIKSKGRFTVKETVRLAQVISKALVMVHGKGILHRDLKPSNIMFLGDNPVITDFGIAQDLLMGTIQTETGKLVGSIPYMSPERIDEKDYDHRADIYALGVIIYEMLTGENPFASDTTTGTLSKIATVVPRDLSLINKDVPKEFASLIALMLVKDPEKRLNTLRPLIDLDLAALETEKLREEIRREEARKRESERTVPVQPMQEPPKPAPTPARPVQPKPPAPKKKSGFAVWMVVVVVVVIILLFVLGKNAFFDSGIKTTLYPGSDDLHNPIVESEPLDGKSSDDAKETPKVTKTLFDRNNFTDGFSILDSSRWSIEKGIESLSVRTSSGTLLISGRASGAAWNKETGINGFTYDAEICTVSIRFKDQSEDFHHSVGLALRDSNDPERPDRFSVEYAPDFIKHYRVAWTIDKKWDYIQGRTPFGDGNTLAI